MVSKKKPFSGRSGRKLMLLLGALLLAVSCSAQHEEEAGGETHFLTRCDADSSSCGPDLVCLCGACTLPCNERTACEGFPVAECVTSTAASCGPAQVGPHCDVSCASDADCSVLSPAHRCDAGACRTPSPSSSSGAAGAAGASEAGGADAGSAGAAACVKGAVPANELLLIGDSFLASSHQITAYLEDLARSAGTLAAGERYRDNSRLTANALAFGGNGIHDEYQAGVTEATVKVVIMNGGGADVLASSCAPNASCPSLEAAAAAARDLFTQMATDGAQQVIYAFYPDPVDPSVRAQMDTLRPLVQSACAASPVPCAWLDLRPTFAGHYSEYVQVDGLNPTAAGSQASAEAIAALMRDQCIAQ